MKNIKRELREFKESLFVAAPVIVKDVYYEDQRADVKLKTKNKDKEPPKILDVPVGHKESSTFSERQMPEVDDVAWVVFTHRSIDKAIEQMGVTEPEHDRILDINDCFLAGEWSVDGEGIAATIGSMSPDDWLIGLHRDTGARVYIRKSSGNIVVEPPPEGQVELTEDPNYSVPLFELLAQVYNTHTHSDPVSGTTGPPNMLLTSQHKSDRVKVDN